MNHIQEPKNPWPYSAGFIKAVASIPELAFTCPPSDDATKTNKELLQRVSAHFPDFDSTKFGTIQGSFPAVMKGLSKFDNDAKFNVTLEEQNLALDTFKKMMPHLESRFRVKTDEEVLLQMPSGTASGAEMKLNGCKTKMEAISKYLPEIIAMAKSLKRIPLFRGSGKYERILREKIIKGDVRLFISSPIDFIWKGMLLFGTISDYIGENAEEPTSPIKIGMEILNGSLLNFFQRIAKLKWKLASDVSKWDGRYLNELFDLVAELKVWMHDPNDPNMSHEEYIKQVQHYYDVLKSPYVIMPDGNIYNLCKGQMSGVYTTSQDNSLAHVLIMIIVLLRQYGQEELLKLWKNNEIEIGIVGDDNCSGVPTHIPYSLREKTYLDCGMILKPSMEFCSEDINGITFLSFTYDHDKILFNRDKILCSLVHEPVPYISKRSLLEQYVARIGNLSILAAYDEPLCDFLIQYYQECRRKFNIKLPPPYPLCTRELQKLWIGYE